MKRDIYKIFKYKTKVLNNSLVLDFQIIPIHSNRYYESIKSSSTRSILK